MTQLIFPLNITLDSPRPIFKAYLKKHTLTIMADKNVYGVGYYDKKETIYIFSRE